MICYLLFNSLLQITIEPTNWQDEFKHAQSRDANSMLIYSVVNDGEWQSRSQVYKNHPLTYYLAIRGIHLTFMRIFFALNQTKAIRVRNSLGSTRVRNYNRKVNLDFFKWVLLNFSLFFIFIHNPFLVTRRSL